MHVQAKRASTQTNELHPAKMRDRKQTSQVHSTQGAWQVETRPHPLRAPQDQFLQSVKTFCNKALTLSERFCFKMF